MTNGVHNRERTLQHALNLEYLTVGWNILEGVISLTAALAAGSVALLGFGADSFVESASAAVLIWRLRAEHQMEDREVVAKLDVQAHRLVGLSLFLLAAYIAADAARALWQQDRPHATFLGIAVTSLSLGVMWWLSRAKRDAAIALESRALGADAFPGLAPIS